MNGDNNGCFGISSLTLDNKHIVMVDSDIKISQYNNFLLALGELQEDFLLSDFYIFKTKHGFNAATMDKVELELLTNMLYTQPIIDELFIYFNNQRGYYTLKFNADKKFIRILESKNVRHTRSYAHKIFFKDILNVPVITDATNLVFTYDCNFVFEIINY